jgi:signal transduction histidine kinase
MLVDTLLDSRTPDEQRTREYLQLIASENLRLTRLIENFLTFSRMERRKVSFKSEEVSPEALVRAAADAAGERLHAPDCRFEIEIQERLPAVIGDADALVRVLLNLLDNAWKYSHERKHIVLRAYACNGQVCLAVQDNGIGLPRRMQRRIFDRFFQADQHLSRRGNGCGLGLSIVRYIVRAHGGTVRVDSEPGSGSTFTVSLPAAPPGPRAQP